jgi:hypothetical protein
MNTSILRKVMMLVVLLAGYVSVMGACCADCCGQPDYTTRCNSSEGYCLGGNCISGQPEPPLNKCLGKNAGDLCPVSDDLTGTCVDIDRVLRCLLVVECEGP